VDIDKRSMAWGDYAQYRIHALDDRHISAYQINASGVGGEVWVLNRVSGEYLRATVFVGYSSAEAARKAAEKNDSGRPSAQTYRGKCSKPLL
jgi:hypothetical protein